MTNAELREVAGDVLGEFMSERPITAEAARIALTLWRSGTDPTDQPEQDPHPDAASLNPHEVESLAYLGHAIFGLTPDQARAAVEAAQHPHPEGRPDHEETPPLGQ